MFSRFNIDFYIFIGQFYSKHSIRQLQFQEKQAIKTLSQRSKHKKTEMQTLQRLESHKAIPNQESSCHFDETDTEFQMIKSKKNFTVAVRVKPQFSSQTNLISLSVRQLSPQSDELRLSSDGKKYEYNAYGQSSEKKFIFDKVFESEAANSEIFSSLIERKLSLLKKGVNLSIMAYGATNSGKTYTIFGKKQEQAQKRSAFGLSYLTFKRVFEIYSQQFNLSFSFVQIYNQNVYDLLNASNLANPLNVMEDSEGNNNVVGLNKVQIKSAHQLENLIHEGNQARVSSSNVHNMYSSRSHAFMELELRHKITRLRTKIVIVDLAGSQKYIYNALNGSALLKQGSNINKSLLSLGNCIKSLYENDQHIPYRDSKLTRLLKENLNGFAHNIMVACINKKISNFEENLNSLTYASKAIKIEKQISRKIQSDQISEYQCTNCQQKLPYSLIKEINKHQDHMKRVKTRESQSLSISPISKNSNQSLFFKSQSLNSAMKVNIKNLQKLIEQSFESLQNKLQNSPLIPQFLQNIIEEEKKRLKMEIKQQILSLKHSNQNKTIHETSNKQIVVSEFETPSNETGSFLQKQILTWRQPTPVEKKVKISLSKPKRQLQNTAATNQSTESYNYSYLKNDETKFCSTNNHIKIQDDLLENISDIHSFRSNLTVQILNDKDKILNERKKVLEEIYNQRKRSNHTINLVKFKSSQGTLKNKVISNFISSNSSEQLPNKERQSNKENFIKIQDKSNEVENFDEFLINQRLLDSTCVAPRMRRDQEGIETWKNIIIKNVESPTNIFSHSKQKTKFQESFVEECIKANEKNQNLMRVFRY